MKDCGMRNYVVQTRCNQDSGVGPLSFYKEGISFAWVMGAPTATRDKQKSDTLMLRSTS